MARPCPLKIIRLVFQALLNESSETDQTLTDALCVCWLWYELCIAMGWKDVLVNNFKLSRFHAMLSEQTIMRLLRDVESGHGIGEELEI